MKQLETKKNITKLINQYSIETNIPAEFIEKDVYVVKILALLSKINYPNAKIVFSGGTCLSKALCKIKRFSEDIDFCVQTNISFSRKNKSNFRKYILAELGNSIDFKVIEKTIIITNENNFFSFLIEYNPVYKIPAGLRKNIKVEFKFENLFLPTSVCTINSFLHPYINDDTVDISCINLLEVMANKLSALLWRCYTKNRSKPLYSIENDPTVLRHLYDISALGNELKVHEFAKIARLTYVKDINRGKSRETHSFEDFANVVINKLQNDKIFKTEYEQFVNVMCYSKENISFEHAVSNFVAIVDYILAVS